MKRDKKVDAYIERSADFAKPILNHLRKLVRKACPEVEEKMKWSFPHFDYKGMMASMAAFKHHCTFGFWKGSIMKDPHGIIGKVGETAMGSFGRITSRKDLPHDEQILEYILEAMRLNDEGIKLPAPGKKERKELVVPDDFKKALNKNSAAKRAFESFAYSHRKEYLEWITEAKREETRTARIEKAVVMLADGKSRNYKYEM